MKIQLNHSIPMMKFMSEILGPDAELVLYDTETMKAFYVINPLDEEMVAGSGMRSLERSFLENKVYKEKEYIVNYRALSKRRNKLKSATLFIKDEDGGLAGILTVNVNVDKLIELRDVLNIIVSGKEEDEKKTKQFYDSFEISVEGMVRNAIKAEVGRYGVEAARLSHKEKMNIVRILDERGIFLVKGAIGELASVLGTTETSIYRYLNKLNG